MRCYKSQGTIMTFSCTSKTIRQKGWRQLRWKRNQPTFNNMETLCLRSTPWSLLLPSCQTNHWFDVSLILLTAGQLCARIPTKTRRRRPKKTTIRQRVSSLLQNTSPRMVASAAFAASQFWLARRSTTPVPPKRQSGRILLARLLIKVSLLARLLTKFRC